MAHYGTTIVALLPIAPLLYVLTVMPGAGTISDALSEAETVAPLIACVLGFAFGNALQWWLTDRLWQVIVLPFYIATVFTTWRLETLTQAPGICSNLCFFHLVSLGALVLAEFFVLYRYVNVSALAVGVAAVVLLVVGVVYRMEVDTDDFDPVDSDTLTRLRLVGLVEVLYFVIARLLGASNALSRAWF